jgi:hypothetical protein
MYGISLLSFQTILMLEGAKDCPFAIVSMDKKRQAKIDFNIQPNISIIFILETDSNHLYQSGCSVS